MNEIEIIGRGHVMDLGDERLEKFLFMLTSYNFFFLHGDCRILIFLAGFDVHHLNFELIQLILRFFEN